MTRCIELSDHHWITDLDDYQKQVTWCDNCGEFWSDEFWDDSSEPDSDWDLIETDSFRDWTGED